MKLYVSATLYYGYEIEVPDELVNDKNFNLQNYAAENDPIEIDGVDTGASCECFINSIFNEQGEEYYVG